MGLIPGVQGWFNFQKSINVTYHMTMLKKKKSNNHVNRCRESIQQNPKPLHDECSH